MQPNSASLPAGRAWLVSLCAGLLCAGLLPSCAALTSSQLSMVNNLALKSDSVSAAPSLIFSNLAHVRKERGVFYAASLTQPQTQVKELNAIGKATLADEKLAEKASVYVNVLNSYLRALRSVANEQRWKSIGTELRGVGTRLDSIIIRYNDLDWGQPPLPESLAKTSGKVLGWLGEGYMKQRQAKAVREFVAAGDTLVGVCVDELVALLKRGAIKDLIANEKEGLQNNYLAYLNRLDALEAPVPLEANHKYLELNEQISLTETLCSRCITALQSLKRAHHKLPEQLQKRERIQYMYEELFELNILCTQVNNLIKKW